MEYPACFYSGLVPRVFQRPITYLHKRRLGLNCSRLHAMWLPLPVFTFLPPPCWHGILQPRMINLVFGNCSAELPSGAVTITGLLPFTSPFGFPFLSDPTFLPPCCLPGLRQTAGWRFLCQSSDFQFTMLAFPQVPISLLSRGVSRPV